MLHKILGILGFHGLVIPVRTIIREPKIVLINNVCRISTLILSVVIVVFYLKAYLTSCKILLSSNAWMDDPPLKTLNYVPTYCDNDKYNFIYDQNWDYQNITCAPRDRSIRFRKSLAPGSYFAPTMLTKKTFEACPSSQMTTKTTTLSQICTAGHLKQVGAQSNSFVMWAGHSLISTNVAISVPEMNNYDSKKSDQPIQHNIFMANGTIYRPPPGSFNVVKFSMSEWVAMFGLTLDEIDSHAGVAASVGDAHVRQVGLKLTIGIEASNVKDNLFGFPGEIYINWRLNNAKKEWTGRLLSEKPIGDPTVSV